MTNQERSADAGALGTELCEQCGQPLTAAELPDGLCERCAEEVRNVNFVEVEVDYWREQQG